jgi:hypothetical protein
VSLWGGSFFLALSRALLTYCEQRAHGKRLKLLMKRQRVTGIRILLLVIAGIWACGKGGPPPATKQPQLVSISDGLPTEDRWRQDFVLVDMNGDDEVDIVTAPPRKSKEAWPHIFLARKDRWEAVSCPNVGQNGFPQKEYAYGGVAVADFDGDNKRDIAIAMHEAGIRLFLNKGDALCGPWEEQGDLPNAMMLMRTRTIATADFNHDGRMDLVALAEAPAMDTTDHTAGITIFWNEPTGWRHQGVTASEGLFGDDLTLGEINGDGTPDIAVGSLSDQRPQFVWLSDGKGGWTAASAEGLALHILAWATQLVDIDNDGKDDLLLSVGGAPVHHTSGPRVYRWDGAQWRDFSNGLPPESLAGGVAAIDLDRDGKKEIVVAGIYTGTVYVYGQRADGTWEERQQLQIGAEPGALRSYKVRTHYDKKRDHTLVVANYAGEHTGKILAWTWR